jgi:two-component system NarL family sensor kinase
MTPAARLARLGWWPSVVAWLLWALALLGGVALVLWFDHLLRRAGRPDLVQFTAGGWLPSIACVSAATVGAVLAARWPRHPVGWLLLALALDLGAAGVTVEYAIYGFLARPGALPAAGYVALYYPATVPTALALLGFVLLFTPTGLLPSPRWRWWAWVTAAAPVGLLVVVTLASEPLDPSFVAVDNPTDFRGMGGVLVAANQAALTVSVLAVLVAAGSLVVRFRRARGIERLQLRWVALAAAVVSLAGVVVLAAQAMGATALRGWAAASCLTILPLAIGAAVLRYRLYDLDRIISRTLVYGLLTTAGILLYVGVVRLAETLLRGRVGLGGSLLATALIAVGFAPARDRLQRLVDRRLYGERHDPIRAVARLGERLRGTPGGPPAGDGLAELVQGVCEALRLPFASLHAGQVQVARVGQPDGPSESVPLDHGGERLGELVVGVRSGEDALGVADRRVLELLAAPLAVALHAVLLSQELQRSRERLVATREEERRRLRRDLHDGLGPILTAVTLKADAARSALGSAPERTDALLAGLRADAKQAIGDLRRVVYDLRPAALDELGLLGALRQQVDRFDHDGVATTIQAPAMLPPLPAAVEVAALRITTEALTNIARHAHARQTNITLTVTDRLLWLEIHDDGISTGVAQAWRPGVGLQSMADRAAEVGGVLQAGPTSTGGRVQARLPLELP